MSHDVPDYDALYRKFIIEMEQRKADNRKNTKQEPFTLLTESRTRPSKNTESRENSLRKSDSLSRLSEFKN